MIKYAVHPGKIQSIRDGDWHFIGAGQLIRLYRVPRQECLIIDPRIKETHYGIDLDKLIHLHPKADGNYTLPEEA